MEGGVWTVLVVVVVFTALAVKLATRLDKARPPTIHLQARRSSPPPGPRKFPLVGNLPQLSKNGELLHVALGRLARTHGPVMRVWFGAWQPVTVVSSGQAAWEVFVSRAADYAARGATYDLQLLSSPGHSSIFSSPSGAYWHSLRRGLQGGALAPLHVYAQTRLQEEDVSCMAREMQEEADAKGFVRSLPHIRHAVVRLLSRLCFGPSFDDDKFAAAMVDVAEETALLTSHGGISDMFRFLRPVRAYIDKTYRETCRRKLKIQELLRPVLSSKTLSPSSYAHFLLSQRNVPLDAAAFLVFEVFLLGMDSTANTTAWALLFLTLNPVVQEKLYQEIRDWCSDKGCKTVRAEDVSKLQYLQAVLKETLRMKPIAPVVPRMAVNDTTVGGNKIPRGSEVLVNVYAVHYDAELWPEPHRFMPERFLPSSKPGTKEATKGGTREDGGGDVLANKVTDKSFLPFGGGMKSCAGMEVGKLQVAFTVANLVNAFRWSPGAAAAGEGQHPTEEHLSFVLMMKNPFAARITPRSHV